MRYNNEKPNATYEPRDTQTRKNCNGGTALERSAGKLLGEGCGAYVLLPLSLTLNSDTAPVTNIR